MSEQEEQHTQGFAAPGIVIEIVPAESVPDQVRRSKLFPAKGRAVAIKVSRQRHGPALYFTTAEWTMFITQIKAEGVDEVLIQSHSSAQRALAAGLDLEGELRAVIKRAAQARDNPASSLEIAALRTRKPPRRQSEKFVGREPTPHETEWNLTRATVTESTPSGRSTLDQPTGRPPRVTMDDILRVASFQDLDPAREAMVITAVYHRLANDIADPLRSIVNWYGFSTWSSRTIGEDLDLSADSPFLDKMRAKLNVPKRFSRQFRRLMVLLLGPSYRLGLALANRSIFLETGSVAVNLQAANLQQINLQATDSTPPQNLGFSYRLRDPDPATDGASAEEPSTDEASTVEVRLNFVSALLGRANEEYLDYAATFLAEAAQTTDIDRHAELILGANVALSAFEQARAQVMLELVLHRPCRWLLLASWRSLLSAVTGRPFRRLVLYTAPHEQMPWPVRQFEDLWVKFHTRFVMTLRTPVSEIRLGRPLRPPPGCDPEKAFAPIRDDRVRRLVETFVPDPERKMAGATNWLDYADRMRFIVAYFRTYLSIGELLDPPFSETVLDQLYEEAKAGSVPDPVYCEWFQRRETKYRDKANRPGVKGWLVRRFYRPPMAFDPDAVELARLDLRTLLEAHTISPKTP